MTLPTVVELAPDDPRLTARRWTGGGRWLGLFVADELVAAGAYSLTHSGGHAFLHTASVAPEHRGRGYQRILIRERVAWAAAAGRGLVYAAAMTGNWPSLANLRAEGFGDCADVAGVSLRGCVTLSRRLVPPGRPGVEMAWRDGVLVTRADYAAAMERLRTPEDGRDFRAAFAGTLQAIWPSLGKGPIATEFVGRQADLMLGHLLSELTWPEDRARASEYLGGLTDPFGRHAAMSDTEVFFLGVRAGRENPLWLSVLMNEIPR